MLFNNVHDSPGASLSHGWAHAHFAWITKGYAHVASKADLGPITLIHPPNGAPKSIKEK